MLGSLNLAARAGRWSATHWKTATGGWILLVAVAIGLGTTVGTHMLSDSEQGTGETAEAEQILTSAGFKTPASESVLVRSATRTTSDPAFRSTVQSVLAKLRTMPRATTLVHIANNEAWIRSLVAEHDAAAVLAGTAIRTYGLGIP